MSLVAIPSTGLLASLLVCKLLLGEIDASLLVISSAR